MLAGLADATAKLLNLKRKAPVKTFKLSLPSKVVRAAADPAGRWVALVDQVGGAEIFSVKSRERVATVRIPRRKIVALAFAPGGGDTMAVALTGGILQLRRLPFGDPVNGAEYRAPDALTSVAFSPDGRLLAASSVDGRVRVFPASPPWKKTTTLIAGQSAVTGVAFGGKDLLAAAQPGRGVHLWTRTGGRVLPPAKALALPGAAGPPPPLISLPPPKTAVITRTGFDVSHWAVSCHSTLAAVTDGTKHITMYDARNGKALWKIRLPAWLARDPSAKIRLTFSPGGNHLIGFHPTGWVFRWQTQLRRGWRLPIYRFTGLVSVLFAHNARSFLATRRTGRATLFTATGRRMGGFNGIPGAYWVAISPNGRTAVHIKGWDEIAAYRLPGGRRIWRRPSGRHKLYEVLAVNFSENSKTLRTYHASGFARRYNARTGRLTERRLVKFSKDVRRCSLRQDLEVLACAVGSEVQVRQIGTSKLIRRLTPPSGTTPSAVKSMAFNLHGEMLAAAYGPRTLVIWHFPPIGK
jgi:WD40 repeat protein